MLGCLTQGFVGKDHQRFLCSLIITSHDDCWVFQHFCSSWSWQNKHISTTWSVPSGCLLKQVGKGCQFIKSNVWRMDVKWPLGDRHGIHKQKRRSAKHWPKRASFFWGLFLSRQHTIWYEYLIASPKGSDRGWGRNQPSGPQRYIVYYSIY